MDKIVGPGNAYVAAAKRRVFGVVGIDMVAGALSEKRNVIEDRIRECGGVVVSSVSKNTDMLVTNESDPTSSKFKKALELKIKIITEKELFELME